LNCFYVQAEVKKDKETKNLYKYSKVTDAYKNSILTVFLTQIENGNILVDFDARTGHNHGTKFRMRQNCLPELYEKATVIV
jgi:hypothetical protein